jgi:hypothetical protein
VKKLIRECDCVEQESANQHPFRNNHNPESKFHIRNGSYGLARSNSDTVFLSPCQFTVLITTLSGRDHFGLKSCGFAELSRTFV